jgi:anti-sigma factor RsiW
MTCRETIPLLNAYRDGELDLMRTLDLESHVRECGPCAAILETEKHLAQAVATAPYYRASPSLRARVESPGEPSWRRPATWLALAASLIVALFVMGRGDPSDDLGKQIVQAHLRSVRAGHLLDIVAAGRHTVRPWFAGKLDYALNVQDISGRGFALAGGRLDSLNGRTVAVLVYQRGSHAVNVFVWPAAGQSDRSPEASTINGLNLVNWRADGMNWWAVSDLGLADLEELPLCPCFMPVHETLRS